MSGRPEDLAQLMEITGLTETEAKSLLQLNNFKIEQAVNYHLEAASDCQPQTQSKNTECSSDFNNLKTSNGDSNDRLSEGVDFIRAPIPSKREQLVLPEDDNFRFKKRRIPVFSVCPLRNFAREAEIQEEELNTYLDSGGLTSYSSRELPGTTLSATYGREAVERNLKISEDRSFSDQNLPSKRARLEDLFRPPIDLLFWGTFGTARDHAFQQNRWLIVNLQDNSEFKSQVINRDIWSYPKLKNLVQKYFILWQVSVDNPEGLRFKTFYKVEAMPYICIIDPRTGEEKQAFNVVTAQTFAYDLTEYLSTNSYSVDKCQTKSPSSVLTRFPPSSTVTKSTDLLSNEYQFSSISPKERFSSPASTSNSKSTTELSEEDQIALAIKNSLNEKNEEKVHVETDKDEDVVVLSDSDEEVCSYESFLGDEDDPMTTLQIRLPNGDKTQVEWPLSTKLRAIRLYVQFTYPEYTNEPFKIISAFPRQNILELRKGMSLADANLHPRAILHLHPDV